jgi:hypothetical protein
VECCHKTQYFEEAKHYKKAILQIEELMKKVANKSLIFHQSTIIPDGSAEAYLAYVKDHYHAYKNQLNETLHKQKKELEILNLQRKLFQVTSTTLEPGWEKYYDNSSETTTTPYPALKSNESEYNYLLEKKKFYEEALRKEEINAKNMQDALSIWSDENYFG